MRNRVWLIMKSATGRERPFPIEKPRTVIGSEPSSDVRIPIRTVAPRHCEITVKDEQLRLTDLGSEPGTLHNGHRVKDAILSEDDELTVGPVTFSIRMAADPDETRV